MSIKAKVKQASKRKPRKPLSLQIRMVSMIDVVFLLLIYFLLTSNFRAKEGYLPIALPQENQSTTATLLVEPLIITVHSITESQCEVSMGPEITITATDSFAEMATVLNDLLILQGRAISDPIKLMPAPQSQWHHVVKAYDALWQNNMTNIIFSITEPL